MKHTSTFATFTMGCRVNQVETERLRHGGVAYGFQPAKPDTSPDLIIINTCSVTSESDRQARQLIRRLLRKNPNAHLVVTGCYAQGHAEQIAQIPGVLLVLGNHEKEQLWHHLSNHLSSQAYHQDTSNQNNQKTTTQKSQDTGKVENTITTMVSVSPVDSPQTMDDIVLVNHFSERSRAFLQVQDGCDCHCTFCTIPALRGPSRSIPVDHLISQTKRYLTAGYQEIVLTGINLGAYGRDLEQNGPITPMNNPPNPPISLATIVTKLSALIQVGRLRLSSLDPNDLDEPLMDQFASNPTLCPYLHLSVQSGDDMILKRMGRGYGRDFILEKIKRLRTIRPDMVFGADLIVGFPTETTDALQNSLTLIEEAGLTLLHVFRYSDRPGTPAASIPDQFRVPAQEIQQRSEKIRQAGVQMFASMAGNWIGQTVEVLVEKCQDQQAYGKTASFLPVNFPTKNQNTGQLVTVQIRTFDPINHLFHGISQ